MDTKKNPACLHNIFESFVITQLCPANRLVRTRRLKFDPKTSCLETQLSSKLTWIEMVSVEKAP